MRESLPDGYICKACKQFHSGLPISFAADGPDSYAWLSPEDREKRAIISTDQCILDNEQYFIRGLIEIPIIGFEEVFLWGVWARVFGADFQTIESHWTAPQRERLIGPFKGRLNNRLSEYPDTLNLKCRIEIQPVSSRPLFQIAEPDHPLAIEQRNGISLERVQQIASNLMHR